MYNIVQNGEFVITSTIILLVIYRVRLDFTALILFYRTSFFLILFNIPLERKFR